MRWFRKRETRADTSQTLEDLILKTLLKEDIVTREMALNIPTVGACVELIGNTIATLPINLYKVQDGKVKKVENDNRIKLLNDDTGDTLDGFQLKKALVEDYLLEGNGYAYINKVGNSFKSLHYVKEKDVSININSDPIFKDYDLIVNGNSYRPYEFIKVLRKSKNGATGIGIVQSNPMVLAVAYNSLKYENVLAKTGGNKKGFIKADGKLDEDSKTSLKEQWNKLYSGNSENCIVLNSGLDFKESASTSTEMQLNENKESNGIEICKLLNIPPSMLSKNGSTSDGEYERYVKMAILPILKAIITALNRDLLLEREKGSFYYAFDIKELLKGDLEKRFKAYEIGIKNGFLGVNEVRYEEDREPIEAFNDIIKLGLQDVLYNVKTNEIYTPNTDKTSNLKGGEVKNEDRDKE